MLLGQIQLVFVGSITYVGEHPQIPAESKTNGELQAVQTVAEEH